MPILPVARKEHDRHGDKRRHKGKLPAEGERDSDAADEGENTREHHSQV